LLAWNFTRVLFLWFKSYIIPNVIENLQVKLHCKLRFIWEFYTFHFHKPVLKHWRVIYSDSGLNVTEM